jgi:hypothetical protein
VILVHGWDVGVERVKRQARGAVQRLTAASEHEAAIHEPHTETTAVRRGRAAVECLIKRMLITSRHGTAARRLDHVAL